MLYSFDKLNLMFNSYPANNVWMDTLIVWMNKLLNNKSCLHHKYKLRFCRKDENRVNYQAFLINYLLTAAVYHIRNYPFTFFPFC